MAETRKSISRRRISRRVQPVQYESLEISVEIEDEITWSTPEERAAKMAQHAQVVLSDFQEAFSLVCTSLGVQHKAISVKRTDGDGKVSTGSAPLENRSSTSSIDDIIG